jgi:ABC-type transport system involved in cytochrome c biogenesis permease subunit
MSSTQGLEERKMNAKKRLLLLTTVVAAFTGLLDTCRPFVALCLDESERVPMMMTSYSLILIALVGAAIIGSAVFLIICAAELVRRRQRKYSCIQH